MVCQYPFDVDFVKTKKINENTVSLILCTMVNKDSRSYLSNPQN